MKSALILLLTLFSLTSAARAAETPVAVMAAGSLRAAMTEMSQAFQKETGVPVETRFGPAGSLHERIEKGEKADLFASADMAAPEALVREGKADKVTLFARNRMCVFVRPGLAVTSATLLDKLLDPALTLGTSTPKADPGGDYAWAIFARAEAARPGSGALLEAKARRFLGRSDPRKAPEGVNGLAWMLSQGEADLFIAYCSGGQAVLDQLPGGAQIDLPADLTVTPEFGLTRLTGSSNPATARFADFILSAKGREILVRNGFQAP